MKSRLLFVSLIVFVLTASLSGNALASNEGPGTSTGTGQVFFTEPGCGA